MRRYAPPRRWTKHRWAYYATLLTGGTCIQRAFYSSDRAGWIVAAMLAVGLAVALLDLEGDE